MRPKHLPRAEQLNEQLLQFSQAMRPLPGIADDAYRATLVAQMVESLRRIDYANAISARAPSPERIVATSGIFDPERAAIWYAREQNLDEAIWLIFLATACGKHGTDGWALVRDVYGKLGSNQEHWGWAQVCQDPTAFQSWLADIEERFRTDGVQRRFGNHRKYSNLRQLGEASATYVTWIAAFGDHRAMLDAAEEAAQGSRRGAFDYLYRSMKRNVKFFGRLGRFDFLTMIGKLGLAPIEPGSTYMSGATGPFDGATLLFGGPNPPRKYRAAELDAWLGELDQVLGVGMQVLEDALCNWQKSPRAFQAFRG